MTQVVRQAPPIEIPGSHGVERDAWSLADLDLEPEQCFCLQHGDELPCPTCRTRIVPPKENRHV